MAKRRNLKKEKALRNQAYARKFRKRSNAGRFGKKRYGRDSSAQDSDEMEEDRSRDSGGAAEDL
jgi:hypothetical protein